MLPIRQLSPLETDKYLTHLLLLDDESKRLRFAYPIPDSSIVKFIAHLKTKVDKHKIFVIEDIELNVIAVGHVSLEGDKMELAFSVLKEHQGKGYGSALMEHCVEWCRNRGINRGFMVCLHSNDVIKHLAKKHSISLHNEHGETTAELEFPFADAKSFAHEFAVSTLAAFDYFQKSAVKAANDSIKVLLLKY